MNSETSSNNKRIAKNTLALYFRMFIVMGVSLFTSRVILQVLGVEDFGIYNLVGGVVAMMGVINSVMTAATNRFIAYELGRGDQDQLKKTFSVCLSIYILISIIFLIIAEALGVWFVNTQLTIPEERMGAANWVYQFSIAAVIVHLLQNPFNATLIAHERMNVYAYISVVEAIAKLAIVYMLMISPIDKLIMYGLLMLIVTISITGCYAGYSMKHYPESRYRFVWDAPLFKRLISYSGWSMFGALGGMFKGQGLNVLLGMFFNPSVNAARGIAYQINNVVKQFFTNFYTAVRPQITKYYAKGQIDEMMNLVFKSSKLSYYLILLLSLPIIVETPAIIQLWLGQLPENVVPFVRLIILITAIDCTSNPIMTTAQATGNIKLYQFVLGMLLILNVPVSYVALKLGASPVAVFEISLAICCIEFFTRLWLVNRVIDFPIRRYLTEVCGRVLIVTILSALIPVLIHNYLVDGIWWSLANCALTCMCTILIIYFVGTTKGEKEFIHNILIKKLHRA